MIWVLLTFGSGAALVAVILIAAARFALALPSLADRPPSASLPPSDETALGRALSERIAAHPGLSGIVPLLSGADAFASRYLLAEAADRTIDARYYIWQNDASGILLLDALRRAALRGVRVRLLVDDNGIRGLDPILAALEALPHFEVRLFNPFTFRRPKVLSYLFDFPRLNRRMHNKSFTIDDIVTIVGGRNIGDTYFERGLEAHYFDLDVLAVGRAAADVSADFDAYWSSGSSYPIALFVRPPADGMAPLDRALETVRARPDSLAYNEALATSAFVRGLIDQTLEPEWVETTLLSDDPAKGLGRLKDRSGLMGARLARIFGEARRSVDLVSAYFVPGPQTTRALVAAAEGGIRVRTMTNSLEATDVMLVHAGYVWRRNALVAGGVEVLELKSGREHADARPKTDTGDRLGILGSSTTSLHAKTFIIDGERVFIGSFNFDPRSAHLNCEMGFLIESTELAALLSGQMDSFAAFGAYRVLRDGKGRLEWIETDADGRETIHYHEPRTAWPERLLVRVVGWLPITWML